MASESNATLHKAMQLHMGNLKMLSKPLNELQREIPSMEDIDEDSESNITEVQTMTKKVRIYQNILKQTHEKGASNALCFIHYRAVFSFSNPRVFVVIAKL